MADNPAVQILRDADTLNRRGLTANKLGQLETARKLFLAAAQLVPSDPRFLLSAGNMRMKLGETSEALGLYERIVEMPISQKQAAMVASKLTELPSSVSIPLSSRIDEVLEQLKTRHFISSPAKVEGMESFRSSSSRASSSGTNLAPLSMAEIKQMQTDCLAEDVAIKPEMLKWPANAVRVLPRPPNSPCPFPSPLLLISAFSVKFVWGGHASPLPSAPPLQPPPQSSRRLHGRYVGRNISHREGGRPPRSTLPPC